MQTFYLAIAIGSILLLTRIAKGLVFVDVEDDFGKDHARPPQIPYYIPFVGNVPELALRGERLMKHAR